MDETPAKSAHVVIEAPADGLCIVMHAGTRKYFRMGEREAAFLASLDGRAAAADLEQHNCSGFNPQEVRHLLAWFQTQGLTGADAPPGTGSRLAAFFSGPDKWRIHLLDPDALLERHLGLVHALFSRPALACYLAILLLPVAVFAGVPGLLEQAVAGYAAPMTALHWVVLYLAVLAMIAIHEMAHAVTCKHFGGRVHKIGLMLLYLQPVMYCDVSDSWRFRDVEKKIAVAAAGIFVQLLVSSLALCAWAVAGWPLLLYFGVINVAIALFNLFPLLKLDGYWMLVHALDEPNLRKKGFDAVARALRRVARRGRAEPIEPALLCFGAATLMAVTLFWCLGLAAVYRYSAQLSELLALGLATALGAWTLLRGWTFMRNLMAPAA